MTAVPMTAVAVGTTSGWFALEAGRAATATTTYDNEGLRGTSTASYTHECGARTSAPTNHVVMRGHVSSVLAFDVSGGGTANRVHRD